MSRCYGKQTASAGRLRKVSNWSCPVAASGLLEACGSDRCARDPMASLREFLTRCTSARATPEDPGATRGCQSRSPTSTFDHESGEVVHWCPQRDSFQSSNQSYAPTTSQCRQTVQGGDHRLHEKTAYHPQCNLTKSHPLEPSNEHDRLLTFITDALRNNTLFFSRCNPFLWNGLLISRPFRSPQKRKEPVSNKGAASSQKRRVCG